MLQKTNLIILLLAATLLACSKSSPGPSAIEKATKLMTASPWTMTSLSIDDVYDNTFFTGMKLTFTASGFSATNGAPVWPASGTWSFTDSQAKAFSRNDGISVQIDNLTTTDMKLTLTWTQTTTDGGRIQSVAGKHTFTFTH